METRKVQQVGGGTYTVSLPREWADECGVEAGAPVYLYPHRDGSLVVRRREREASDLAGVTTVVDSSSPAAAERRLRAAYTAGFEQITLEAADSFTTDQRRAVTAATRALTGVEVTESAAATITVEAMLDATDVSVRQSVLQLRFAATSMQRAAVDALVADAGDSMHVQERKGEVDRAVALVTRHFNRSLSELSEVDKLGVDRGQLFRYYETARHLERVGDHAVAIADVTDHVGDLPAAFAADLESLALDARSAVGDATDAVVNGADADAALDARRRVLDGCSDLELSLCDRSNVTYRAGRVLDRVSRTAEDAGALAEIALRDRL